MEMLNCEMIKRKNLKNISIIKLSNSKIVDFYKRGK